MVASLITSSLSPSNNNMSRVCIVTDSSVQFSLPSFQGRQLVKIFQTGILLNGQIYDSARDLKPTDFPAFPDDGNHPKLLIPTEDQILQFFAAIEEERLYDQVLGIFTSSNLSPFYEIIKKTMEGHNGRLRIQMVDSQTLSIGLGFLVQAAADLLIRQGSLVDGEHLVRSLIPHIYSVFCTPGLSYLYHSGFIDFAQAMVGEYLGMFPLFTIEDGHFSPLEKVRNHRQVLDFFQEFLDEFENLQHISLVQNSSPNPQDGRLLREHVQENHPKTPFTEHSISPALATQIGPQASALFAFEATPRK
jgi:DegV family protein with EDD domain